MNRRAAVWRPASARSGAKALVMAWTHGSRVFRLIFDFRGDGSAGAGPDPRKARLDVTRLATDSGKRSNP